MDGYSYLIVHTHNGVVKTQVAPTEVFTDDNVERYISTLDGVTGWAVREIDESSNVISMERFKRERAVADF